MVGVGSLEKHEIVLSAHFGISWIRGPHAYVALFRSLFGLEGDQDILGNELDYCSD